MKHIITLAALFLSSSLLVAQITFSPNIIDNAEPTANAANTVTTGDFDGDGDIDVIGGAYQADHFSIYRNDGNGNFTRSTIDNGATADGARFATTFDLDEDGDLDILATSSNADAYLWYENDGGGLFTPHVIDNSALANEAYSIGAADFDNDGDMDIVGGANAGDALVVFANDGNENFLILNVLSVGDNRTNGVRVVKVADVDQDTNPDIVVAAFAGDTFSWYENDGNGVFTPHTIDDSVNADGATAIDVADLDGDGDMDIAAGSNSADQFLWYENDGSENFSTHIIDNTSSFTNGPRGLSLVDLEQDGDMDIITAAITGDAFAWYENDGSGVFTGAEISTDLTYSDGAFAVTSADIDGDLVEDIITAANIADAFSWFKTEGVIILEVGTNILEDVKVYPNPVYDQLNVKLPAGLSEVEILIFDNFGKMLWQYRSENQETLRMDMSQFATGIYYMKVSSSEGIITKKIIKK
ncbi:MAG: T9SS C-terminal target domain-containing protein [Flavobacterium sp.]|nr:MAG: T9SS C-terminal target domain-containing protein [Flavobacterium sp.]